jgi:Zn finger protein HypA/HybF involved in hydrogenase expression
MSRLTLAEQIALQRADEQMAQIKTLRTQHRMINCLECHKRIPRKRHKFGFCTKCLKKYKPISTPLE